MKTIHAGQYSNGRRWGRVALPTFIIAHYPDVFKYSVSRASQ